MAGLSVKRASATVRLNDVERGIAGVSKAVYLTVTEIIIYIMAEVSHSRCSRRDIRNPTLTTHHYLGWNLELRQVNLKLGE